jgi:hypothetical protein
MWSVGRLLSYNHNGRDLMNSTQIKRTKEMHLRRIVFFILLFFLIACSPSRDTQATIIAPVMTATSAVQPPTHTNTPTDVPTNTPTATSTPTATPAQTQTSTPVPPTPTLQIPPEARLQIKQMPLFDTFPDGYQGEGYVVLLQERDDSALVIDLATLEKSQITLQSPYLKDELGILSPDGEWIIRLKNLDVEEPQDVIYEVLSAEGKLQSVFTLPWDWVLRYTWINNQQILADKKVQPDTLVYETMAIDALTGQMHPLLFDYPDIYEYFTMHYFDYNIYDPSLHYVIYPAFPEEFILRDVIQSTTVVTIPVGFAEPSWSPDGKMFAIGSGTSIYGGYLDGQFKSLTHVEQYTGVFGIGDGGDVVRWSPDGRSIAFDMSPLSLAPTPAPYPAQNQRPNHCLAILDVESEAVTDYCISGYDIGSSFFYYTIWAFDSRKLLVYGEENAHSPHTSHVLMIDLDKEIAIDLGEWVDPLYIISTLPSVWMKR